MQRRPIVKIPERSVKKMFSLVVKYKSKTEQVWLGWWAVSPRGARGVSHFTPLERVSNQY